MALIKISGGGPTGECNGWPDCPKLLFDADTDAPAVVWIRYSDAGRVLGYDRGSDDVVASCIAQRDLALSCAVPLDEFTETIDAA